MTIPGGHDAGGQALVDFLDRHVGDEQAAAVIHGRGRVVVDGERIRAPFGTVGAQPGEVVAVVAFEVVVQGVVVVEHDPLAVLGRRAGGTDPVPPVSEGDLGLPAQGVILGAVGHAGHVPTRAGVQAVGLTDHIDQVPIASIAEGAPGAVDGPQASSPLDRNVQVASALSSRAALALGCTIM